MMLHPELTAGEKAMIRLQGAGCGRQPLARVGGTRGQRMERFRVSRLAAGVLVGMASVFAASQPAPAQDQTPAVCRPVLGASPAIELGKAGVFTWTCSGPKKEGGGYYIVFVRPLGTYELLKVPQGRTSFEFTPDVIGAWRWIVINTDPDRAKPDVESEQGSFYVISSKGGGH